MIGSPRVSLQKRTLLDTAVYAEVSNTNSAHMYSRSRLASGLCNDTLVCRNARFETTDEGSSEDRDCKDCVAIILERTVIPVWP